jgi:hypothetical protein
MRLRDGWLVEMYVVQCADVLDNAIEVSSRITIIYTVGLFLAFIHYYGASAMPC